MSLLLFLWCMVLSGCTGLLNSKLPGPWYDAYEPIEDPAAETFLSNTLEKASARFGAPAIPVNEILLRRSRKTEEARRYRIGEDFSLTECVDPTNGVFVVYIGVDPDHSNYYALLAHECVHLLNPYITDWYMEGLATVFSEEVCASTGKEWGDWKRHFVKSRRDPYALSYRMMLGLKEAFPIGYPAMIQYTVPQSADAPWLRIDIDHWIGTLPTARQSEARAIIEPYTAPLRRHTGKVYGFHVPGTP